MRSASKRFSTCVCVFAILVSCYFIYPLVEADSGEREVLSNGGGPESQTADGLQLRLVWFDAYRLLPHSFEGLSGEVNRIFGELGVDVQWENGEEVDIDARDESFRLYVVLLPSNSSSWGLGERVAGAATHGEGKKGAAYLFYPQIVKTLGLKEVKTPRSMKYLARAIGRVVAHEVIHVLAPHHPHTDSGLMNRHFSRRFLTQPHVHLDYVSSRVVREEIQALGNRILLASGDFGGESAVDGVKGATRHAFVPEQPR